MEELQEYEKYAKKTIVTVRLGIFLLIVFNVIVEAYSLTQGIISKLPWWALLHKIVCDTFQILIETIGLKYLVIADYFLTVLLVVYCVKHLIICKRRLKEVPSSVLRKQFKHLIISIIILIMMVVLSIR